MIVKLHQNKKYSRNFQYIEYGIKNLLEQPAVFGEKRTQNIIPEAFSYNSPVPFAPLLHKQSIM
jgi:hypothetical protein